MSFQPRPHVHCPPKARSKVHCPAKARANVPPKASSRSPYRLDSVSYPRAMYNLLPLVPRDRYRKMDKCGKLTEMNSLICEIIIFLLTLPLKAFL